MFCVLSGTGGLTIGRNVHISAHNVIVGQARVDIGDFCTVSVRCSIFSSIDDYSGAAMANPRCTTLIVSPSMRRYGSRIT